MAIFGRSFPFPQTRVHKLVGPASTVRATIIRPVRLPDRTRPLPRVTVKTRVGAASTVRPQYVHPVRLADRPRPKPGVFIGKALPAVTNVVLTAAQGSYTLTGQDAQFITSRFASPTVRPYRLPDRPRPFPHVTIKTLVGPASTVRPQYIRARLPDRPRPKLGAFVSEAPPIASSNTTLTAAQGSYTITGADAAFINSRFASPTVKAVRLPDRPRPFAHVFIGKARLAGSVLMPAATGLYVLTGIDAGLIGPPEISLGLRWNLERAGWPKRRRKPTLLEILADIIEEDPPPKLAEKLSRRKKAKARVEAEQWATEIVERAQHEAKSYELEFAKATIATALREHAKSLIDAAVERRLDQEEEEAILLLLSHYH